jgi:hypothetical protein
MPACVRACSLLIDVVPIALDAASPQTDGLLLTCQQGDYVAKRLLAGALTSSLNFPLHQVCITDSPAHK